MASHLGRKSGGEGGHPRAPTLVNLRANRHRGESRLSSPATPPYMRVRIRRFGELSYPANKRGSPSESKCALGNAALWTGLFASRHELRRFLCFQITERSLRRVH